MILEIDEGVGGWKSGQKKQYMVFKPYLVYSGCQKDVPFVERIFLQPLIPPFRISALIFEKRYKWREMKSGMGTRRRPKTNGTSVFAMATPRQDGAASIRKAEWKKGKEHRKGREGERTGTGYSKPRCVWRRWFPATHWCTGIILAWCSTVDRRLDPFTSTYSKCLDFFAKSTISNLFSLPSRCSARRASTCLPSADRTLNGKSWKNRRRSWFAMLKIDWHIRKNVIHCMTKTKEVQNVGDPFRQGTWERVRSTR